MKKPGQAWLALTAALAAASVLAWWAPAWALDWQPALAAAEPWRAFSAAFVHWSPMHLGANLGAAAAVAAFGWAAKLPPRAALAWGVAWPLTHVGLLLRPELAHYGGLSGLLHGGVAVVVLWLLVQERGAGVPSAPWWAWGWRPNCGWSSPGAGAAASGGLGHCAGAARARHRCRGRPAVRRRGAGAGCPGRPWSVPAMSAPGRFQAFIAERAARRIVE